MDVSCLDCDADGRPWLLGRTSQPCKVQAKFTMPPFLELWESGTRNVTGIVVAAYLVSID